MKVYVIINPENGWDNICRICKKPEGVIDFFNEQGIPVKKDIDFEEQEFDNYIVVTKELR